LSFARKVFDYNLDDPDEQFNRIEWVDANLTDVNDLEELLTGVENVYHSAAMITFRKKDLPKMFRFNVDSTVHMVNAALRSQIKKFCHVSSVAAIGRPDDLKDTIDENLPWKSSRNNSGYAKSKYASELEVWRGIAEGLPAVIVNPSIILGIANPVTGSSHIFKTIWDGLKFYPPGVNGYVDVKDVVRAILALMESDITNQRFILNGANLHYQELFEGIATSFGKPAPNIKAGHFLMNLGWRLESLKSTLTGSKPLMTRETVRTSMNKHYYSNEKIKNVLNFEFTPIEQTIENYGLYYKNVFEMNDY